MIWLVREMDRVSRENLLVRLIAAVDALVAHIYESYPRTVTGPCGSYKFI